MTSPVGHTLGGWILGKPLTHDWRWLIFIVFAANAPDLDFLPGALQGDLNRYHHMASHSITAMLVFSALVYLFARRLTAHPKRAAVTGALAYSSHLLLDYFTVDEAQPLGLQLLWPLSDEYLIAPFALFTNIEHGEQGDTLLDALGSIFSAHNLGAIALELIILLPILIIIKQLARRNHNG